MHENKGSRKSLFFQSESVPLFPEPYFGLDENLCKSFRIYKNYLYIAYMNLYSIYFIYASFDV